MMYRYIIFDLDGTLLDSSKKIKESEISAIRALIANGKIIMFASGRHLKEIQEYLLPFALTSQNYIVCCDGQYVFDANGKQIWKGQFLSLDDIKSVQKITKNVTDLLLITDRINFLLTNTFRRKLFLRLKAFIKRYRHVSIINNTFKLHGLEIEKIKINKHRLNHSQLEMLQSKYNVNLVGCYYEILNQEVCKYNALSFLQSCGAVDLDDALFFGDDSNDKECFDKIKHCVAMNTAPENIKLQAEYITADSDHGGVSNVLKKIYIFIREL